MQIRDRSNSNKALSTVADLSASLGQAFFYRQVFVRSFNPLPSVPISSFDFHCHQMQYDKHRINDLCTVLDAVQMEIENV